ncbi:sensor histidine kinase [Flavobacterium sp. H122]|uniref:tetratricopeptide repeat-containing sensor histidine kinase n=1 Tax=Flavobacterium sp. H122 TaxID=2529860 RepID=UPI00145AC570|nr:sensor histidine kinase [Flavobacterium sp. H122]
MTKNQVKTDSISYYISIKKPLKALSYTKKKSNYLLDLKKYDGYCSIMHQRAQLFEDLNDRENAIKTLLEYSKIADKYNLTNHILNYNRKLANLYISSLNFSNAKKYLYTSKKIALKSNDIEKLIEVYQAFFRYHKQIDSDSLDFYYKKHAELSSKSKNVSDIITYHDNALYVYTEKKDFIKAKFHIEKAIELARKYNLRKFLVTETSNYGAYLIYVKKYKEAIKLYKESLKDFKDGEFINVKASSLLNLSYSYEMIGDYKNAMFYNNKYLEIYDEIMSGRLEQSTQEIETKYQVEKAEEEFKNKTQAILYKQKRNQKIIYLMAALFILLGGISYFFYQNLRLKQYNKLKDINSDLQGKIISATIDGQEQERVKISEILHDSVSATLSSVGLHLSAFESSLNEEQREDLKKTRSLLKQAHDKVRDLSHELVPPLLVKFGLQFALRDLCENHSNSIIKFFFSSELPNTKKFKHDFEIKIYYIVSELFNNAIKHSKATEVYLNLHEDNRKRLVIFVQDNGKGFNTKETQLGFGLTQIKARVKNMKGNLIIDSEENAGTKITIELPHS